MAKQRPKRPVKTLETTFDIFEYILENEGASLPELTESTQLTKSTVHRHVLTLYDNGYLVRDGNQFRVAVRMLEFGDSARHSNESYEFVQEKLKEIAQSTKERVQFMVEEHGYAVYAFREIGENAIRLNRSLGRRVHMHSSAGGKAILAEFSDEEIDRIIDKHGLPSSTESTITDRDELFEEIERTRERGFSINDQEHDSQVRAVGVPVHEPNGEVLGAISVSGPSHRFDREMMEETIIDLLLGFTNEIEVNLAHM